MSKSATEEQEPATGIRFRLRAIFLPYLLAATGIFLGYSAFHWLLRSHPDGPQLDEMLLELILPMALPLLVILFYLRHRVNLLSWWSRGSLTEQKKKQDPSLGYLLAWLAIAIPTSIAQHYVREMAGTLTPLQHISQIGAQPKTRFYTVSRFAPDNANARRAIRASSIGRHNETWVMSVYYAVPLYDPSDTSHILPPSAWLAQTYSARVSNRLGPDEKQAQLNALARKAARELMLEDYSWVSYFTIAGENQGRKAIEEAIQAGSNILPAAAAPILIASRDPFESRAGDACEWAVKTFIMGTAVWLVLALCVNINRSAVRDWAEAPASNRDLHTVFAFLRPHRGFFATPLLLDLNILVWIVMVFNGLAFMLISGTELLHWGGLYLPKVRDGEVWRLISHLFVHTSVMHVLNNMVALWILGLLVEGAFGTGWFASVYFVTGLVSAIVSMLWHPAIVSAGASGCIFGVAGFGLVLLVLKWKRFSVQRPMLLKIAGLYLGLNIVFGLIMPDVDLTAHLSGLACGGVLGLIAAPFISDSSPHDTKPKTCLG